MWSYSYSRSTFMIQLPPLNDCWNVTHRSKRPIVKASGEVHGNGVSHQILQQIASSGSIIVWFIRCGAPLIAFALVSELQYEGWRLDHPIVDSEITTLS
jgi:hypothetical protein